MQKTHSDSFIWMQLLLKRSKKDKELAQSLVRVLLSLVVAILIFLFSAKSSLEILISIYALYSAINLHHVAYQKDIYFWRRDFALVVDMMTISMAIYLGDRQTLFLYPLYLYIIVGNGVRYGEERLKKALVLAVVGFFTATQLNPHWEGSGLLSFSLSAGMAMLALFFKKLIHELTSINASLEGQVKARTADLAHELYHDRLTGLKNRYALDRDIKESFSPILLIDIDAFHDYNELYGVDSGNDVLKLFASYLQAFAQKEGYEAYRIYGDGFILKSLQTHPSHELLFGDITKFLEQIGKEQFSLEIKGESVMIEIAVTIAISLEKAYALEKANIALKHARIEQKEFLAYYHALNTETELKETLHWRKVIKEALQEDNMEPFYQPIVNREGKILKYEVLVRLKKEDINGVEYVSPFYFLDIAIKTKQYRHITQAMIRKSFAFMKDRAEDFSINLLFTDIKDRELMQFLKDQILLYDVADRLILEIVESEDIKDYKLLKSVIGRFRELGVRVAIDDFGAGFSNYAYILEITPDYLKIDGSLIKEIDTDENAYKLVGSIQTLASSLGIKTIAEYIHSKEVFEATKKLNIDEFQGFYFHAPMQGDALAKIETNCCI